MRNPIFAADSIFLDTYPDGGLHHRDGQRSVALSCGGSIVRLEEPQPLVEIGMASGMCLILSPETAFSLQTNAEGLVQRYMPIAPAPSPIDWQADLDDIETRRWALIGMTCGSGVHTFNRFRASYLIVPDLDLAANVTQFLRRLGDRMVEEKVIHKNSNSVTLKETDKGFFVRSRILTQVIGVHLQELTQALTIDPSYMSHKFAHALLTGLLSTADKVSGEIVIRHRSSATIRSLAHRLTFDFGVACDIHIHPMEPPIQSAVTRPEAHRFRLSAEQINKAVLAGLLQGQPEEFDAYEYDRIESVTPIKNKQAAVIVLPGKRREHPLTVNSYVFSPQFVIPAGITEIATHPALLDSSDPTAF